MFGLSKPLDNPLEFNLPLAQKVLTQVTEHPETHNQVVWGNRSGTRGCIAGWTLILDESVDYAKLIEYANAVSPLGLPLTFPELYLDDNDLEHFSTDWHVSVPAMARKSLGVTMAEANRLFLTLNERMAVKRLRKMINHAARAQSKRQGSVW